MTTPSHNPVQIDLDYQKAQAIFGSQFVVNASDEEVFVDVSAGVVVDSQGTPVLPIHTRLALTWNGAQRLHNLLTQALRANEQVRASTSAGAANTSSRTASSNANATASATPPTTQAVSRPKFFPTEARLPIMEIADVELR